MKRNMLRLTSIVLTALWIWGCAHVPVYNMSDIPMAERPKHNNKIGVVFERYTGHKTTGNINVAPEGLVEVVAKHLKKSGLFPDVEAVKDRTEANKLKGFDAILSVKVLFYEGDMLMDRTVENIGIATRSLLLTAAGSYKEALFMGFVTLEVKVLKVDGGTTLWQGEVKGQVKRDGRGSMSKIPPSEIADEALKDAVRCLIEELEKVSF
jgi:hypothetical protein